MSDRDPLYHCTRCNKPVSTASIDNRGWCGRCQKRYADAKKRTPEIAITPTFDEVYRAALSMEIERRLDSMVGTGWRDHRR